MSAMGTPSVRLTTAPDSANSPETSSNLAGIRDGVFAHSTPLPGRRSSIAASCQSGEFTLNGFRNRDLQLLLYGPVGPNSPPLAEREAPPFGGCEPETENPPRSRLDPEGPQNPSLSCHSHGRLAITAILTMDRTSIALLNKAAA